jgi:hypothetical protein
MIPVDAACRDLVPIQVSNHALKGKKYPKFRGPKAGGGGCIALNIVLTIESKDVAMFPLGKIKKCTKGIVESHQSGMQRPFGWAPSPTAPVVISAAGGMVRRHLLRNTNQRDSIMRGSLFNLIVEGLHKYWVRYSCCGSLVSRKGRIHPCTKTPLRKETVRLSTKSLCETNLCCAS